MPNAEKEESQEEWRKKDAGGHLVKCLFEMWALYLSPEGTGKSCFFFFKPQHNMQVTRARKGMQYINRGK